MTSGEAERVSADHRIGSRGDRRWLYLFVGLAATLVSCAYQYGLGYLLPAFRAEGLSLPRAGLLVSAPIAGTTCGLVVAGLLADRFGEQRVLGAGLLLTGLLLLAASTVDGTLARAALLVLAGASAASAQATSGRLVLRFPARQRGLAMGIRQTAQPLGIVLAALALPPLAAAGGTSRAFSGLGCACLVAGMLALGVLRDAPELTGRPVSRTTKRLYGAPFLWRVHTASALLILPQFAVAAFSFDYLVTARGWSDGTAGALLGAAQFLGAAARLGAGVWSDRVGRRLQPMRVLAIGVAAVLGLLAGCAAAGLPAVVVLLVAASAVSVSTNGLSNTAVTERAGAAAAGRVMGTQNTAQNLVAAGTPPILGALIAAAGGGPGGYAIAFAVSAGAAALAVPCIPVRAEAPVASLTERV
jgi:sugar phosphate permease